MTDKHFRFGKDSCEYRVTGDEKGVISSWNVTALREFIDSGQFEDLPAAARPYTSLRSPLEMFPEYCHVEIDHAMSMPPECLKIPCYVAEFEPGQFKMIDGNHRCYKAIQMGIPMLPMLIIPWALSESFRRFKDRKPLTDNRREIEGIRRSWAAKVEEAKQAGRM